MGLIKILALFAIIYLSYLIVFTLIKPINKKSSKRIKEVLKEQKRQQKKEKIYYFKDIILKKISKNVLLGENTKEYYEELIGRLDLKISPYEIRATQILYFISVLIVSLIVMKINLLIGLISLLGPFLGWLYPIDEMEKKIEKQNKNIMDDFPAFYSLLYYQYSRTINIYLSDVVRDFIPNANNDMSKELGIFLDNIEEGEEYALKQFKKRVPLRYIIKFCDMMQIRLNGYDNTAQMTYLKNELNNLRLQTLEDELENRENKNVRTQFILIIVLAVYVVVYFYFQFMDAVKMFS